MNQKSCQLFFLVFFWSLTHASRNGVHYSFLKEKAVHWVERRIMSFHVKLIGSADVKLTENDLPRGRDGEGHSLF
jgi:hypothetical protein